MRLPDPVLQTVLAYVAQFPVPQGVAGPDIEEACRQWSLGCAQQCAFSHPNQGWGTKRADLGRPISKDTIANNQIEAGKLLIWDLVTGAGTGQGRFVGDVADSQDATGQTYVPVDPVNHLPVVEPPTPPLPPPDPPAPPKPPPTPPLPPVDASFLQAIALALTRLADVLERGITVNVRLALPSIAAKKKTK